MQLYDQLPGGSNSNELSWTCTNIRAKEWERKKFNSFSGSSSRQNWELQFLAAFEGKYPHKNAGYLLITHNHSRKAATQTGNLLCMKSVPVRYSSLCCLQQEITAPQSFMTAANIWLTECNGNYCLRWFTNPSATAGNSWYHRAYYLISTAFYLY